ncbi:MAG TPA: DNA polymerase Y family protein, partial [Ramlibacter sp.]
LRTAQPTQDMKHLRRLASEQLARSALSAPASQLRLRTLETVPGGGVTTSLLPEDNRPGEKLHQLVERLSVRLGEGNVTVPQAIEDHRPECMQRWLPARTAGAAAAIHQAGGDALYPPWLLREPLRLQVKGDKPSYQGPLQLLTRARRVEAAWWDPAASEPAVRDYFIARSASAGLLWIYRERLAAGQEQARWFLHGLYA